MTLIMPATTSGRFVGCFMGRTFLVGLENNIPNSFLNGIVFLFWCISGLKERIMSHICDDPLCVACELRFLFRMFDQGLATQKEVSTGASSHHHITYSPPLGCSRHCEHAGACSERDVPSRRKGQQSAAWYIHLFSRNTPLYELIQYQFREMVQLFQVATIQMRG